MWVRGLKQRKCRKCMLGFVSHPMWVRGLKPKRLNIISYVTKVAPHVGAWIETPKKIQATHKAVGRTPCGCVD